MVFPSKTKVWHVFQYIFPVVAHSRYIGKIIGKEQNNNDDDDNDNVFIYSLVFST